VGIPYSSSISISGGSGGFVVSLISGGVPPGLTRSGSAVSGSPTVTGSFSFVLGVTDSVGATGQASCTFVVTLPPTIACFAQQNADIGLAFSAVFPVAQGTASGRFFSITVGSLPAGLSLSASSGSVFGTPSSSVGNFSFSIQVRDSATATATASCFLLV
jgi:hypothetical protein